MILSRKYKEELNKIVMSEEMKKRILHNVLDENIEPKNTMLGARKYSLYKRNMQIIAACFTVVACLSVAKSYPQILKHENVNLQQKEIDTNSNEENKEIPSSEENKANENKNVSNNDDINTDDNKNINTSNYDKAQESQSVNQNTSNGESSKVNESASNNINKNESENENSPKIEHQESNSVNSAAESNEVQSKTPQLPSDANNQNKEPVSSDKILKDTIKNQDATLKKKVNNDSDADSEPMTMAGYSIKEYKTLKDAENSVGFKIAPIKVMPKDFNIENIYVESNEIIQIEYVSGQDVINFRAGKEVDNISGDYNDYQFENTVNINGVNVNLKGDKSNVTNLATWKKDNISYSISDVNGDGKSVILNMVKSCLQ